MLLLIAQQKPKKAARAIRSILQESSEYEQWLHRDLLFAGSCLAENPKDLKVADAKLPQEILERLIALEVGDKALVGGKVRQQVFTTLCSFGETDFEGQVLQMLKAQGNLIEELRLQKYQSDLGDKEEVISNLLARLKDEDFSVRFFAVDALCRLGLGEEKVIDALLVSLEDKHPPVRYRAADSLGKLGQRQERVLTTLLELLKNDDSHMRLSVASALYKLDQEQERVIDALLLRLDDDELRVCNYAVLALGKLGHGGERVLNALLGLLEDDDSGVHSLAASALGKLGKKSPDILPTIVQWLERHQDSKYLGDGIDALWDLVVGERSEKLSVAFLHQDKNQYFRESKTFL